MSKNTDSSIFGRVQDTTNAEHDSSDVHGENHKFSGTDQGDRTRCIFCSGSRLSLVGQVDMDREATPLDHYRFLHEACSACRRSDESETRLCDFCRHIHLRHFFSCPSELQVQLHKTYHILKLEVDFGGPEETRSRQNCGLCRLVADTVSIHAQEALEGNQSSIRKFTKLEIKMIDDIYPNLYVRSNRVKDFIEIQVTDLSPFVSTRRRSKLGWNFRAPVGKEIPWDDIRKSLPNIKPSPMGRLPSDFRLIDVSERRCVTVGPSFDGTFAALSYVWGSATGVGQAWSAADLHNPPHTIEDALHACQQLGQKYLWVDQICIKQDDPTDKANQIASMAAIYSSASLVIVAARGESVHSGISGMHLARGKLEARESFLDFELAIVPDFDTAIYSSIWSTRGWTLQEVALAKFKVYFSSTGVWLQYEEHGYQMAHGVEFCMSTSPGAVQVPAPFSAFSIHLWEYTHRKLTYDYDIYNAFSGIMTALFGGPEKNIYGLPEQHFNYALLWAPFKGGPPPSIRVLRNNVGQDPVPNPLLPTWSWASVAGGVKIPTVVGLNNTIPLVKWARIAPSSPPSTPTLIDEEHDQEAFELQLCTNDLTGPRFYLAVLWSYSAFDSPSPLAPLQTSEKKLRQRWPAPRDFWHEVSSGGSRNPKYPGLDIPGLTGQDDSKIAQLQPGVLLTRAQSSHVWVDPDGCFRDGDQGALIGRLYGGDRGLILRGDAPKAGVFKCVAISLANGLFKIEKLMNKRCQGSGKMREDMWSDEDSWGFDFSRDYYRPVINVMLIGSEGPFSYRLGVGWILLRRWIDAERVFETILLK